MKSYNIILLKFINRKWNIKITELKPTKHTQTQIKLHTEQQRDWKYRTKNFQKDPHLAFIAAFVHDIFTCTPFSISSRTASADSRTFRRFLGNIRVLGLRRQSVAPVAENRYPHRFLAKSFATDTMAKGCARAVETCGRRSNVYEKVSPNDIAPV